jgi:hypothetical protein
MSSIRSRGWEFLSVEEAKQQTTNAKHQTFFT